MSTVDQGDYRPLMLDDLPLTTESETAIRDNADLAIAALKRMGALDLAPMLGIEGAA